MYRKCVGIILLHPEDNRVLVGRRIDGSSEAWQLPQGGVDEDEDFHTALFREMEEEIGTRSARVLAEAPKLLRYKLPEELQGKLWGGKYVGQEQKWFLLRMVGEESKINISTKTPEFLEYKWVEFERIPEMIVEFKRDVYKNLVELFGSTIKLL